MRDKTGDLESEESFKVFEIKASFMRKRFHFPGGKAHSITLQESTSHTVLAHGLLWNDQKLRSMLFKVRVYPKRVAWWSLKFRHLWNDSRKPDCVVWKIEDSRERWGTKSRKTMKASWFKRGPSGAVEMTQRLKHLLLFNITWDQFPTPRQSGSQLPAILALWD